MESNTDDVHRQYVELLSECFEKIIKLAPRKCDILKSEAKKATGKPSPPFTPIFQTDSLFAHPTFCPLYPLTPLFPLQAQN